MRKASFATRIHWPTWRRAPGESVLIGCCRAGWKLRDPTATVSRTMLIMHERACAGVLQLPEDDPEMWKAILRVLMPSSFVADLVTWVGPVMPRTWTLEQA